MNQNIALVAPTIFDGEQLHQESAILLKNGLVEEILSANKIPSNYRVKEYHGTLLPGFIDLQVNGGGGLLFNDAPHLTGIQQILKAHRTRGTAALLPTLITATDKVIREGLEAVAEGLKQGVPGLLGIHIEGPMINPERKGIHKAANIRLLSDEMIDLICDYPKMPRLITLAPEMVPLTIIEKLTESGAIIFAGHTECAPNQLNEALAAGVKGFTHLYNAMPQMSSRNPATTGYALQSKESYASIINDTFHVDPLMVKLAYQSKPKGKLFLVSDAMSSIGSDQKAFYLDEQQIYVEQGRLTNSQGTLAGAHIDMARSILNAIQLLDISLSEALAMGTSIPAKVLQQSAKNSSDQGSNRGYGFLHKGSPSYLNLLSDEMITPLNFESQHHLDPS
ncbi:N-acetylglucosamine-6-phosphate deacetylase [Ignatzschineria cameli]|uniref:N-acetylglucosamine-6-phosphate deacetylase n=1 Tax=Ignatzschineria cameli TaxID=2182793 RepID=A0A2U2AU14_9GAMM|nr:N-acetylglucosamine-6-phosphate deacetylase [Ignatzschineria cameli]PWD88214.1 N-acetylglucosamine-6-phosphate deacetylase [Ignatzschineria cameli]